MYALSKAQAGHICTIKWMFGLPEAVDFLRQHHVEEGDHTKSSVSCGQSDHRGAE